MNAKRTTISGAGMLVAVPLLIGLLGSRAAAQETTHRENLLANGGFEAWSLGKIPLGPIPPDCWYPMGNTASLFSQCEVLFDCVPSTTLGGNNGHFAAHMTAAVPGGYVSQKLENCREFRGKRVTFSLSAQALDDSSSVVLEIRDGKGKTSKTCSFAAGKGGRVHVTRKLHWWATELEFRIYPEQSIVVDQAQAVVGEYWETFTKAAYRPRCNYPRPFQVPLGAVVDWWRFDPNVPVPDCFVICDGATITDSRSPFHGRPTPDLRNRFIYGTDDPAEIDDDAGGSATVNLSHTHGMAHTHSGTTSVSNNNLTVSTYAANQDGIEGVRQEHTHDFTTGSASTSTTGSGLGQVGILPPYARLLKIVRIR